MKVLITGGAGFIGRATAKALTDRGDVPFIWDVLQERVHPGEFWPEEATVYGHERADVRNIDAWRYVFQVEPPDAVLHLAAYQDYMPDYSTFFITNAAATAMLYEAANQVGWRGQVVVASSQATLGEGAYDCQECEEHFIGGRRNADDVARGEYRMPCPECLSFNTTPAWTKEDEVYPVTPYGVSKLSEELIAVRLGEMLDIPSVALRYSIVQGAGQSPHNAYSGVMRASALQVLAGRKEVILFEDGQQVRDFVSIHDVVDANLRALDGQVPHGGYNVGGGREWSLQSMVEHLIEIADADCVPATPGWVRVGDVRNTLSNVDRLQSVCDWSPHASATIEKTWAEYWAWLKDQGLDAESIVGGAFDNMKRSGVLIEVGG
jgi:dTDP-L-rhamnose 4-epimerase